VTRASSASSADRGQAAVGRERGVLWTVALAAMLVPLNSTMIAVGLPTVVDDLDTTLASASWLVTGYLIAMASLQPVAGKLGDRFGRRPLLLGGMAWFGVASAGAAASGSLELLIFFRVQQAVAGALFFPNAMALLREAVPAERLGSRMGHLGAVITLGAAAGPPLGGALIALGGWQWIFLVNLPLVAASLALAWRHVPASARAAALSGFDRAGAVLLSAALIAGAWALNGSGLGSTAAVALGAGAVAVLALFIRLELRRPDPVLQPRLFRNRAFSGASAAVALGNLAMYVTLLGLPVLLFQRGGFGSTAVGLLLATMSAAAFAVTPLGGRLTDRLGSRVPAVTGLSLQAASMLPLALAPGDLGGAALAVAMVGAGVGVGLSSSALQVAALSSVDVSSAGVASGVFSTSRYVGSIIGTALLAGPLAPAAAGTGGFGLLFAVLALAAAAAAVAALALPGRAGSGRSARYPRGAWRRKRRASRGGFATESP
jgi:EmrB/QacA subfamily drug resistance transporter